MPRVRDCNSCAEGKINFNSQIVPKHLRRSSSIEELLPLLYLKGISTNDFQEALSPLLGENAKNISPGVVSKLKSAWEFEYNSWRKRDLTGKNYIYIWADGIYLQARMEGSKHCVLVIMGATQDGVKELIGLEIGYRESKDSWKELLLDIKARGATIEPKLAVGDGALGFWGALNEVYANTKHQRCWVHKTANILDKLPKSMHKAAKREIQDIYIAENKASARKMLKKFIKKYSAKYPKATECLEKDEETLLTFYDFPAANWVHLRTTNPIESTFATVRHRTYKSKGAFSELTILTMVFKLCKEAEKRWKKLYGYLELPELANGVIYIDGIKVVEAVNQDKLYGKVRRAA